MKGTEEGVQRALMSKDPTNMIIEVGVRTESEHIIVVVVVFVAFF
jgi:hypothetical protein